MINMFDVSRVAGDWAGAVVLERVLWPHCLHSLGERTDRGCGKAVVFIPGLFAKDSSMDVLRARMARHGFLALASGILGRNTGDYSSHEQHILDTIHKTADITGEPVSLVGWSMGGRFARKIAWKHPALIRSLITLGTPLKALRAAKLESRLLPARLKVEMGEDVPECPASIPHTAIVAGMDGVVKRTDALICEPELRLGRRENVIVFTTHIGLGHSRQVADIVARRLSQDPESWQPDAQALSKTIH